MKNRTEFDFSLYRIHGYAPSVVSHSTKLKLLINFVFFSCSKFPFFQTKIHYLDIISGLPSYGAKCFSTNARDGVERVLLVSPRFGLSQITGIRNSVVSISTAVFFFSNHFLLLFLPLNFKLFGKFVFMTVHYAHNK